MSPRYGDHPLPLRAGATTFAASTTAPQALRLPWCELNGVASRNGRWWYYSSGAKQLYSCWEDET